MADKPPKRIIRELGETGNYYARVEKLLVDFGKGGEQETYRAVTPDGVSVMAFTEEGKIVLVHHYRVFGRGWVYELPAGYMDEEDQESPETTALRELKEETGYTAHELEQLITFDPLPNIRTCSHIFIARKLKPGKQELVPGEAETTVEEVTPTQLWEMVLDGTITDSPTIVATLLAKEKGYLKIEQKDVKKGHPF